MPLTEKRVVILSVTALLLLSVLCVWLHTNSKPEKNTPTTVRAPLATLVISTTGSVATLSGAVPNQATKTALINAAEKVFGLSNVVDKLEVKEALAEPIWVDQAIAALPLLKTTLHNGTFVFKDKLMEVHGDISDEDAKTKILRAVASITGVHITVNDQLQISNGRSTHRNKTGPLQNKLNDALAGKIIEFDTSSSRLRNDSYKLLDALVDILKADVNAKIEIGGHTDRNGTEPNNVRLSQRRADVVKKYLIDKGVKSNRISAVGYGSSTPIADENTFDGQRKNRRIEFQVQE